MYSFFNLWSFIFLSCLVGGFIWCVFSRRSIIPLLLLGTVWNVYLRLGLTWNGTKVLVICAAILILFRPGTSFSVCKPPIPSLLFLLSLYVIGMTVFGAFTVEESDLTRFQPSIFQQPPLRGIVATGLWFLGPLCLLIGYRYTPSFSIVDKSVKVLLLSSAIAAVVGAVQFVTYYTLPPVERLLAFFCIQASEGAITSQTASSAWAWYRPTPFCSEPRHFAFAMAFAAATVILSRRCRLRSIPPILTHQADLHLCWAVFRRGINKLDFRHGRQPAGTSCVALHAQKSACL